MDNRKKPSGKTGSGGRVASQPASEKLLQEIFSNKNLIEGTGKYALYIQYLQTKTTTDLFLFS